MSTFSDRLKDAARSAYCSQVSNSPTWFSNLRNVIIPAGVRQVADNLNNWVCGAPSDDTDFPAPPFEGGQCPIPYRVEGTAVFGCPPSAGETVVWATTGLLTGPITGISPVDGQWRVFNGDGAFRTITGKDFPSQAFVEAPVAGTACSQLPDQSLAVLNAVITTNVPIGGPDDCGDPPPDFPPVAPIEINIDFDYGDTNEFNFAFPLVFAPVYVALDGTLNIPISIGEIGLTGNINLNNDFEISLDFSGGGNPGIPDDPSLPTGDPGEDGPDPETPNKERIIGVMVRATDFDPDRATLIPQSQGPDIIAPRCASVKFLAKFGNLTGWTPDIAVKSVREYVPCPIPSGAAAVQVTADFGSTIAFTPIRGRPAVEAS